MAALMSHFSFLISLFFLSLSIIRPLTEAQSGGFSVELIHRDSPKSPFYNPVETNYERVRKALRRSVNRLKHFDQSLGSTNSVQADIIPNTGSYLINIAIGSPPVKILAVADTGSDLIWTQCSPCPQCYKQDSPLFDPTNSSTYQDLSCSSNGCASLQRKSCSMDQKCIYLVGYGDGSFSSGNLASETITLGSTDGQPVPLPQTIFGCGHENNGKFNLKTTGIVGLGGGDVSLISQLGSSIGGKFSYCLVPFFSQGDSSSKINFGSNGIVSGPGIVSTPLIAKDPKTFYYLTLEAISVGNQRVAVDSSSFGTTEGNIVIDSGTTLTYLPQAFSSKLVSAMKSSINETPIPAPNGLADLCYSANSNAEIPDITVHFTGADLKLSPFNAFIQLTEELVCLVFKGTDQGPSIYGNVMQMNFLVGYDTEKRTVSFKQADCTKQ